MTGNRVIAVTGTTSTLTVGGSIGDGGSGFSLTKGGSGIGTLILSGANTYSGGTILSVGMLIANADGALGTGNVSLTATTLTLTLQNGVINNYISDTKSLSFITGDFINLNYTGLADTVGMLVVNGVTQTPGIYGSAVSGAPNVLAQFTGTGTILVLIPEPSTWAMIIFGMGLLIGTQRFRRRN